MIAEGAGLLGDMLSLEAKKQPQLAGGKVKDEPSNTQAL